MLEPPRVTSTQQSVTTPVPVWYNSGGGTGGGEPVP